MPSPLLLLFHPPKNRVILSEASRSLIARSAVEGPAFCLRRCLALPPTASLVNSQAGYLLTRLPLLLHSSPAQNEAVRSLIAKGVFERPARCSMHRNPSFVPDTFEWICPAAQDNTPSARFPSLSFCPSGCHPRRGSAVGSFFVKPPFSLTPTKQTRNNYLKVA